MTLKLVNWNVKWARPRGWKIAPEIRRRIKCHSPEIVCLTESYKDFLSESGHPISSREDYGYTIIEGRRKVLLWSAEPWRQINDLGSDSLPPGRFVSGVTKTSIGDVTVVGVCIPWHDSRTEKRRGAERRERWVDHEQYLEGLTDLLSRMPAKHLMLMGDFNQRIRQSYKNKSNDPPPELRSMLQRTIPERMTIATSALGLQGNRSIDHIALSEDLVAESLGVIDNIYEDSELSDHFGVVAEVSARSV